MNCFAASLQIAGTVITKKTSFTVTTNFLPINIWRKCSLRNRIDSEKTFIAGISFPVISWIVISKDISWKKYVILNILYILSIHCINDNMDCSLNWNNSKHYPQQHNQLQTTDNSNTYWMGIEISDPQINQL